MWSLQFLFAQCVGRAVADDGVLWLAAEQPARRLGRPTVMAALPAGQRNPVFKRNTFWERGAVYGGCFICVADPREPFSRATAALI